jgi:ABC-type bacteriocin/lantibiotic exporter with double-glycine peptidase domain
VTVATLAAVLVSVAPEAGPAVLLPVPIVRQERERCGPAALTMVLRYLEADSVALAAAERAYDPVLRGALVTELARAARSVGYDARVASPGEDSLRLLLERGVPPILLYQHGWGPLTRSHYGVLVGWDPARGEWRVHDGTSQPHAFRRDDLMRRWRAAGGLALLVRPGVAVESGRIHDASHR